MSFLISNLLGVADKLTKSMGLQDQTVLYQAWLGQSGNGDPAYSQPVLVSALVEIGAKQAFTPDNQMVNVKATVTILAPLPDVTPFAGQARIQPVDPHDVFTLPDGTSGPSILLNGGLLNPDTHRPYMMVVGIGK